MGSVPTPRTFAAGEIETAAYLNSLSSVLTFLQNPPRCSIFQGTAGTACPDSTNQPLAFDTEEYDTDGMHSTVTNTSRITPQTPGLYRITGQAYLGTNTTGQRTLSLLFNGVVKAYDGDGSVANAWIRNISRDLHFNGTTDYVELAVQQASGATLTTTTGSGNTFLQARWVAVS